MKLFSLSFIKMYLYCKYSSVLAAFRGPALLIRIFPKLNWDLYERAHRSYAAMSILQDNLNVVHGIWKTLLALV